MRLLNKFKFLWMLLPVAFASCEKDLDYVKLPETPAKLVLASFISPQDSVITVVVSKSTSFFEKQTGGANFVTDASVFISDGANSIQVPSNGKIYSVPAVLFPIVAGKTYTLTVSTPEGLNASASCTVPLSVNRSLTYSLDTVTRLGITENQMNLSWTDIPGEANYYRATGASGYFYQGKYYFEEIYFESAEFMSDEGKDGKTLLRRKGYYDEFADVTRLTLLTTDRHYYLYHKSVEAGQDQNPFSEPSLVYTNVKGGLGVFAAYNTHSIQF